MNIGEKGKQVRNPKRIVRAIPIEIPEKIKEVPIPVEIPVTKPVEVERDDSGKSNS